MVHLFGESNMEILYDGCNRCGRSSGSNLCVVYGEFTIGCLLRAVLCILVRSCWKEGGGKEYLERCVQLLRIGSRSCQLC